MKKKINFWRGCDLFDGEIVGSDMAAGITYYIVTGIFHTVYSTDERVENYPIEQFKCFAIK